jgi:hypothetical protein
MTIGIGIVAERPIGKEIRIDGERKEEEMIGKIGEEIERKGMVEEGNGSCLQGEEFDNLRISLQIMMIVN